MKNQLPIQKNDTVIIEITSLNSDGQGVGRINGYAVFVPGALPGETVETLIIKTGSSYGVAKILRILTPSPDRISPVCAAFPACGGCSLQHMSYPAQLKHKESMVLDAMERIGGFHHISIEPILGMENPERYRNKGSFPFGSADGKTVFGFFAPRSHRLVSLNDCLIQDAGIISVLHKISDWSEIYQIPPYNESNGTGILRHAVIRMTSERESMAVIVTTGPLPHKKELLEALSDVSSVWHNVNSINTNVIFGTEFHLLSGSDTLLHSICGCKYVISPQSFLQVNTEQTVVLYQTAINYLNPQPHETIIDAYCGAGTISLLLAKHCRNVIGIESVPEAISDATRNAVFNSIHNVSFRCGAVETVLPLLKESYNALILDPPRKGCDRPVLSSIANSPVQRFVYISCNPSTLARDTGFLKDYSFVPKKIQPVDMFPFTNHVETVVLMSRVKE